MSNELIETQSLNAIAIFTEPFEIDKILKGIEAKVSGIVPDISTAKGRKDIASLAYKVAQSKTYLDSLGKDLVSDWKDKAKKVDESRKYARDFLDGLKDRVREPLTEWEKAEAEREARELAEKQYQADWDQAIIDNQLFDQTKEIERKESEIAKLKAEAEAVERARIEEENKRIAEQQRIEREARIAQEAKERAIIEAELKIERERQEAARQIEAAERKRLADIKTIEDRIENEKRAQEAKKQEEARIEAERIANQCHRNSILIDALESILSLGISDNDAKTIVKAIAEGRVDHVRIIF